MSQHILTLTAYKSKDKHVKLRIDAIIFKETEVWKIVLNQKIHA